MASDKKVVLVTGGNTGLGLEVVTALYASPWPYQIIIGCRTVVKGENAIASLIGQTSESNSHLSTVQLDISEDSSIETAVQDIKSRFGRLDVLVNNAGVLHDADIAAGKMSIREGFNTSWDVNVTGTHVLTTQAMPLLLKSSDARLIFITSGTSSLTESGLVDVPVPKLRALNASPAKGWPKNTPDAIPLYRSVKTGLNMLMREWHRTLLNDGVKVWGINPGYVATGIGGVGAEEMKKMGARDPAEAGKFIKDVVEGSRDEDVGKVVRANGVQPW
ncbi:Short-chain dehydrogenase/reductase tropE [Colletotrichum siamense]|uniref:Short-chain dehydrogenase/reductase tropE n=1 Tax=Colletotrichum siamense TaxID=690259 RepID=A0A9P5K1Q0_COLSI|nr:Short-chain dehydrogenase/reductase tropE [Colletotrichum siamense]KAF4839321.1 Short-chain dehydrogenase/reductase tropE [Colletotrichum siamense]KAF4852816.1 Short-chain dehydrogenase/reductase tropE [Colletotrichum siamense]KAF5494892.1 Short-chain dehydrogenase/reductase tropE [Colletotrichum siamense]